ncbi:hypothetical protein FHS31_001943 [Sphingomonas vulcanisoli]|uniref:MmcQ/YjbR family DNA-binding protein n=1 Tax=Sphingomonas vulcanisoli TaxID=1658060 RepID=A0ABX0TS23_9SPHN|nr:hypothetical protein [Sphingomonas vulcanisoli]NIJ08326.1 hypothetical protein [Sphingomonas vulcanisoli]
MTFEEAMAYALSLEGTERSTHYGDPAVKANGHAILAPGREAGSFCLLIDMDTKLMLMETDPETYWQTPHYDGWPAVLVREDTGDPDRVRAMIDRARDRALAKKPPRPRKR